MENIQFPSPIFGVPVFLVWGMFFFYMLLDSAKILLRIFVSVFIKDIGLKISFLVVSLSGFGIRVKVAS